MGYEDDVLRLVDTWRSSRPTHVRIEEAWKVACYFFPESGIREGGSHLHVVRWSWMAERIKELQVKDWPPFNYKGEFLLPVKNHKVKGVYIKALLKAIEIQEKYHEQKQKGKN